MSGSFITNFLLVGAGGFLGSGLRYSMSLAVQRILPTASFPWATLAVNVIGCLLIGLLVGWRPPLEPGARLFISFGLLGGFTTYSAFALDTLLLGQQGNYMLAFGNVGLQLLLGLSAVWVGMLVGRLL